MQKDPSSSNSKSVVIYSQDYEQGSDNYIVFQVDDQFLKSLNESKKFEIKALQMEDKAILLTKDKTFSLQRREFSNSFLFTKQNNIDEAQKNFEIIASKSNLLELIPFKPELEKLYSLFHENRLKAEDQMNQEDIGYSLEYLNRHFLVSSVELNNYQFLKRIDATENDGRWFIIDESYLISVFHEILFDYNSKKKTGHQIIFPQILEGSNIEKPKFVVQKCLERFAELDVDDGNSKIFKLTYPKVCELIIKELLLTKESFQLNEFKEIFQKMVENFCPRSLFENYSEEEKTNIENLKFSQSALIVDENNLSGNQYYFQKVIIKKIERGYFPSEFKSRLDYLFTLKKRYFHEELHNWFSDMFANSKELDEMLLKNTRSIQEKLSKTCHSGFSLSFKPFINNIVQDNNSSLLCYYVRFYVSKY